MKKSLLGTVSAIAVAMSFSNISKAELFDRGGGLIYDDVLDVTWMKDANYAQTSGHDTDGEMTFAEAESWVANLTYYDSVRDVTYDDWRLPNATDVDNDGATFTNIYQGVDFGYNITTHSELSLMFYETLGNIAAFDPTGFSTGCDVNAPDYCLTNTGPFINLKADRYWTNQESGIDPSKRFIFKNNNGFQQFTDLGNVEYAWAVRDGDVAAATPVDRIVDLINSVIALNLKKGISNALDAKLSNSLKALEDTNVNNDVAAVNMLYAFIGNVEAQRGTHIDNAEADSLIVDAQAIIDLLNAQ